VNFDHPLHYPIEGRREQMNGGLAHLTEADIRDRCTEVSFKRGWNYYEGGAVRQRTRLDDGIEARVFGADAYRVTVRETAGGLIASCTCPYDWGGECKHIVATLLAWLHEPESFRAAADLQAALTARGKEDLVSILTDIYTVYPHLVDEFGLLGEPADYDPEAVVAQIFEEMDYPGDISIDEGISRMETVARHAERLVRQGRADLARRAYYALTSYCVNFCESYGAHDIFPTNIPYDFAEAYRDMAWNQLEEHADVIETEVRKMLQGEWAPEMLGIEEVLIDVWDPYAQE